MNHTKTIYPRSPQLSSYKISLFAPNATVHQTKHVEFIQEYQNFRELALAVSADRPWSPATFAGDQRSNATLNTIQLLVLDFDDGLLTLVEATEVFAPYKHIIGTSKSHNIEKNGLVANRFRVILALEHPVNLDEKFKEYWFAAYEKWPSMDKACKDSARFFFPCTKIVSVNEGGALFTDRKVCINTQKNVPKVSLYTHERKGKLSKSTKDFLVDGAPDGEWHGRFFKAAMDFKEQGYSIKEAELKLTMVTGALDEVDQQQLNDVYENRPSKYGPRGAEVKDDLRELILRSKFIVNLADPTDCLLLEPSTGITLKIHPMILAKTIGNRNDQVLYQQQSVINAIFDYDRFGSGPIYLDKATGAFVYNQYIPPKWQHKEFYFGEAAQKQPESLPEIYNLFFNHLVAEHAESKEYILDWLATALKDRNYTILTALGEEGIGKGVLGLIMSALFGEANFVKVRDEIFKTKFNGQLANKALVYIDEVALKSAEDHNRLKDVVNDKIEVERKGKDAIYIENSASYYLSANDLDAIKPSAGDRRFSIIQLTEEKLSHTPLIRRIEEMTSIDNIAQLAAYLRARAVERDMLKPFVSARTEDVKEAGLADWEAYVVFDWTVSNVGKTVDVRELQAAITAQFGAFRAPPGRRRIESLCKKYPAYLRMTNNNGSRWVSVPAAPQATVPLKVPRLPTFKPGVTQ